MKMGTAGFGRNKAIIHIIKDLSAFHTLCGNDNGLVLTLFFAWRIGPGGTDSLALIGKFSDDRSEDTEEEENGQ
jgi:hypothetical protein